jgi:ParB-like chromosome segregation protein Spo0J
MQASAPDSRAVVDVPVDSLRTSFAALRSSVVRFHAEEPLAELPLRAVAQDDGSFEVVDGFKRLHRWREAGRSTVPVVLERASSRLEALALVLRSNAPPRTLSPLDEARVIDVMLAEAGVGLATVARVLGRRKSWVVRRHALLGLDPAVQREVDAFAIGPSLAYALCGVQAEVQRDLVACRKHHQLREREAMALLAALRLCEDDAERDRLLRDPLAVLRPAPAPTVTGPLAASLELRLEEARRALEALADFTLPDTGLTDAERRRLAALHRTVLALSPQLPSPPTEEVLHEPSKETTTHHDPAPARGAGADPAPRPTASRDPRDRPAPRPRPQGHPPFPSRGGHPLSASRGPGAYDQARPVP